jgi:hypothetical protein
MHGREVHALHTTCPITHILHGLFQALSDPLEVGVKIKGSAFLKGHLDLDGGKG